MFWCWPPARWTIASPVATGSLILYMYKSKLGCCFFLCICTVRNKVTTTTIVTSSATSHNLNLCLITVNYTLRNKIMENVNHNETSIKQVGNAAHFWRCQRITCNFSYRIQGDSLTVCRAIMMQQPRSTFRTSVNSLQILRSSIRNHSFGDRHICPGG